MFSTAPIDFPIGVNTLCGGAMCNGLCLSKLEYFGNGSFKSNYSTCYPSQFSVWCYKTSSLSKMFLVIWLIFLIPNIFCCFYLCFHKKQILKNLAWSNLVKAFFFTLIQSFTFSLQFSIFICYVSIPLQNYLFYLCLGMHILFFFLFLSNYLAVYKSKSNFRNPKSRITPLKVVTLEELKDVVTNIRILPPIFSAYEIPNSENVNKKDLCRKKVCDIMYTTWQEEGPAIQIPRNISIYLYFTLEHSPRCDMEVDFRSRYITTSSTNYIIKTEIEAETEPIILIHENDRILKLLNKKWANVLYFVLSFFGYHLILDLLYWAHIEVVEIKCVKNAAMDNSLRALAGEKDNLAQVTVQYESQEFLNTDENQFFDENDTK